MTFNCHPFLNNCLVYHSLFCSPKVTKGRVGAVFVLPLSLRINSPVKMLVGMLSQIFLNDSPSIPCGSVTHGIIRMKKYVLDL